MFLPVFLAAFRPVFLAAFRPGESQLRESLSWQNPDYHLRRLFAPTPAAIQGIEDYCIFLPLSLFF